MEVELVNANEIKQLIAIIMDNALKHVIKDGNNYVHLKEKKDSIQLDIQNEGETIPDGEEEKIFERFYSVDKAGNRKENRYGLGLAIAKSIVERHKGSIKVFSKDGLTTFEILFK